MEAWMNIIVMILSALVGTHFYIKSVRPATLEKKVGPISYDRCSRYRYIGSWFLSITVLNYFIYVSYPLPIDLPEHFSVKRWVTLLISLCIAIPGIYIFIKGRKDAGRESMVTKKYQKLIVGGIYEKVRHPQSIGEVSLWFVLAFFLNSPFLVLVSLAWIPIYFIWCIAEEKDLTVRFGDEYLEYKRNTGFIFPKRKHL